MPDPITTLGLAKSASDIVKQALEFARESRNAALAEKLIDAYRDIVELDDTNRQLKRENTEQQTTITELKRRPEIAAKLRHGKPDFGPGSYFLKKDDGGEDGPYCTTCWDVNGLLVRQHHSQRNGALVCGNRSGML
jgi:hypothetical protein